MARRRKFPRHFVVKASGFYFQAMRKGGIFSESLGTDLTAAKARAETLNASWDTIRRGLEPVAKAPARPGTFGHVVERLRASNEYREKKPRTVEELEYALKILEPLFGPARLEKITPDHCERFYNSLRAQGSIHRAAKIFKWFRYTFGFGIRFALAKNNPTLAVRVKHPQSRRQVWEPRQVSAVIRAAIDAGRPCMALAIQIAYDTSLRAGDIRALTWGQFDGESLWLKQQKTGSDQRAPLWPETVAMIEESRGDTIPLAAAPIIRAPHGAAYTKDNFEHRFRDICRAAGIPSDLQFRDIRRTAATELAEGEATVPETAAVTGHSIAHSARMMDTYIRSNYSMAQNAQAKRRTNRKGPKV
jgi:integrase